MRKRIKQSWYLLGLSLLLCIKVQAQSPGYMGKKLVVGYGLYMNPAFSSIVLNYSDEPVNLLHEIFLEYAVGKRLSLGASMQFYNYSYFNKEAVNLQTNNNYSNYLSNPSPNGSYLLQGRNYKFYGKLFHSKYLAPWGKYFIFGLVVNKYTATYDPTTMNVVYNNYNYYGQATGSTSVFNDFGPTVQSFTKLDLFFGGGRTRIFANRIVLDYGYTVNLISAMRILLNVFDDPYQGIAPDSYIQTTATQRMSAVNRVNVYVKVGYLF